MSPLPIYRLELFSFHYLHPSNSTTRVPFGRVPEHLECHIISIEEGQGPFEADTEDSVTVSSMPSHYAGGTALKSHPLYMIHECQ